MTRFRYPDYSEEYNLRDSLLIAATKLSIWKQVNFLKKFVKSKYGDDVRDIDWNVTARHNHPYVKVYEEERELTVMLLVDVSNSRMFGADGDEKREVIAEVAATIAFSAIQNNDKIGVIFFSDKIEKFIPPKKGRKHILFIISQLLDFKPESKGTDISVTHDRDLKPFHK